MERLMNDAPGDTRRILRHFAEGNLGRLQAPAVEALGGRISRNLERLTSAIASGALVIGGGMLVVAPIDTGWHHMAGQIMVGAGTIGTVLVWIGILRPDRGRGRGRR
jgi:ubiquinone biosynthesis protein